MTLYVYKQEWKGIVLSKCFVSFRFYTSSQVPKVVHVFVHVLGLFKSQTGEAREQEPAGFISRGPQPGGGDPSGADQSLPEPTLTPPGPPGPGQHPEDSPRVRRPAENSTQPEEETEQAQTRLRGSELDLRGQRSNSPAFN